VDCKGAFAVPGRRWPATIAAIPAVYGPFATSIEFTTVFTASGVIASEFQIGLPSMKCSSFAPPRK
jgi:ABC-type Fe3+ transport system permease subunit